MIFFVGLKFLLETDTGYRYTDTVYEWLKTRHYFSFNYASKKHNLCNNLHAAIFAANMTDVTTKSLASFFLVVSIYIYKSGG